MRRKKRKIKRVHHYTGTVIFTRQSRSSVRVLFNRKINFICSRDTQIRMISKVITECCICATCFSYLSRLSQQFCNTNYIVIYYYIVEIYYFFPSIK